MTGSQYYIRTDGAKVLVDCGMFQEREFLYRNWDTCPVRPRDIDVVLLTHAHIDHCGLLPKLVQEGFRGPVMTTAASADLAELVLRDSAQIQAEDAAFKKKRHRKEGRGANTRKSPSTRMRDVERTLPLFDAVAYGRPQPINGDLAAVFHDAGHILGSAMIELQAAGGRPPAAAALQRRHRPARTSPCSARPPTSPRPISSSWNRPTATATTRTIGASRSNWPR